MEHEFNFLKKRYNLKKLKLHFDRKFLGGLRIEAYFNCILFEIILTDKRICRRRLISLLHEMCHAKQLQEKRLILNKRDLRMMYAQEVEAEMFAIEEYEKVYSNQYGTCLSEPWNLASYDDYKLLFKRHTGFGYGKSL